MHGANSVTSEEIMIAHAVQLTRSGVAESTPGLLDPYAGMPLEWIAWRCAYVLAELNTPLEVEVYRVGLETKH